MLSTVPTRLVKLKKSFFFFVLCFLFFFFQNAHKLPHFKLQSELSGRGVVVCFLLFLLGSFPE